MPNHRSLPPLFAWLLGPAAVLALSACKEERAATPPAKPSASAPATPSANAATPSANSAAGASRGAEAHRLVAAGARLVDVRTAEEFAASHLPGAVNIPVGELATRLAEVGAHEVAVVVYCGSGRRSAAAAGILRDAGFSTVYDLGPMSAW